MRHLRSQDGFTLMEVLIAMVLSGIVFGATLTALDAFQRTNSYDLKRNEAQDNARNAIDRMARQLRNVSAPSTIYAGALEEAEPYSVAFQTIDPSAPKGGSNPTNAMRVRYCLEDANDANEVLWMQVQRWKTAEPKPEQAPSGTACPDLQGGDWEASQRVATNVTNRYAGRERALFTYGPRSSAALPQITTVEPHVYINVSPGHQPGETLLATAIQMRNANRQPVAAFTVTNVNQHARLDASQSEDPDGLALSYKWFEGSKQLSTTSQHWETGPGTIAAGTTLTFTLEVTDPGGLKSSVTHTITM